MTEDDTWRIVDGYIREIVPFFNVVAYYQLGDRAAGWLLDLFYKDLHRLRGRPRPCAPAARRGARLCDEPPLERRLRPRRATRSRDRWPSRMPSASGRAPFPLELVFKAFGSYFIRRRYREPLYHTVLERYVQLITREGVTQGIFVEGGLTRDGRLRAPKVGPARLRPRHRTRPGVRRAAACRAGGGELRPRARGPLAAARAGQSTGRRTSAPDERRRARWRTTSAGTSRAS